MLPLDDDDDTLTMTFQGKVANAPVFVLAHSCASHCLLMLAFAKQVGMVVKPVEHTTVTIPDGTFVIAVGVCKLRMQLGKCVPWTDLFIVDLPLDYSIILGDKWFKAHCKNMNLGDRVFSFWKGKYYYKVPCGGSCGSVPDLDR